MKRKYESRPRGHKVDIPFTAEERARYMTFIDGTGRAQGPWVRLVVLRAMDEAMGKGDNSGQARDLADYIRQRCPAVGALQGMVEGGV